MGCRQTSRRTSPHRMLGAALLRAPPGRVGHHRQRSSSAHGVGRETVLSGGCAHAERVEQIASARHTSPSSPTTSRCWRRTRSRRALQAASTAARSGPPHMAMTGGGRVQRRRLSSRLAPSGRCMDEPSIHTEQANCRREQERTWLAGCRRAPPVHGILQVNAMRCQAQPLPDKMPVCRLAACRRSTTSAGCCCWAQPAWRSALLCWPWRSWCRR